MGIFSWLGWGNDAKEEASPLDTETEQRNSELPRLQQELRRNDLTEAQRREIEEKIEKETLRATIAKENALREKREKEQKAEHAEQVRERKKEEEQQMPSEKEQERPSFTKIIAELSKDRGEPQKPDRERGMGR